MFALTYAIGVTALIKRQSLASLEGLLLHLVILGQIAPFLSYSVYRYFPVHIIAIHLSIVLVGMVLLSGMQRPHNVAGDDHQRKTQTLLK
jgi:hypothetical protein